jgi:hypothetical protein
MPDPVITYPCFLAVDQRGNGEALHMLTIDGHTCLVLFTNANALRAYVRERYAGQPPSTAEVNKFGSANELLTYLKDIEGPAAGQGAYYVAFDPEPRPTVYRRLRELIEDLEKEVEPPAQV